MVILLLNDFLPFSFYRQLLSWYTLSQNPNVSAVGSSTALLPLWVRCDMSDPAGTTWFGAENVSLRDKKVSGFKLYSVTCKGKCHIPQRLSASLALVLCHFNVSGNVSIGSSAERKSFTTLDELKQEHKKRHHPSSVSERCFYFVFEWMFIRYLHLFTLTDVIKRKRPVRLIWLCRCWKRNSWVSELHYGGFKMEQCGGHPWDPAPVCLSNTGRSYNITLNTWKTFEF